METLFGGSTSQDLDLSEGTTLEEVIKTLKDKYLKEREELFIQDNTVRAGIIVMVNDTDWELLDTIEYKVQEGDSISFISTLHGG